MKSFKVENVKLSVSGNPFGPEGGTRAPYSLFSGTTVIEYLATETLPVWRGERELVAMPIFGLVVTGQVLSGEGWNDFEYAALSSGTGKTLRRCGSPSNGTDTITADSILMPTMGNYPYPTIVGWEDWEKAATTASNPSPAGDWYQKPQDCLGSGYFADGAKVSSSLVIPGTEVWCSKHLLSRNSSTFRAYYHPNQGVRRSETPVTGDGWKLLPLMIGKEYHSKESKRALVFHQTNWWNVNTSLEGAQCLSQILRENKAATATWYTS